MLLALRELKFARGRFALMGVVIALISVLVVLLSILSSGLVNDGVSGLEAMPATAFVFDEGTMTDNAFSRSVIDDEQLSAWQDVDGIVVSEPLRAQGIEPGAPTQAQIDGLDFPFASVIALLAAGAGAARSSACSPSAPTSRTSRSSW